MKKFTKYFNSLSSLSIIGLMVLFTSAMLVNGNLNITEYGGYDGRIGLNVNVDTETDYIFNANTNEGRGYRFETEGTNDSCLVIFDTTEVYINADSITLVGRVHTPIATSTVASANNLTVGTSSNTFVITGTTQVNLIDTTGFLNGDQIVLVFNGSVTVADSSARSGAYAPINLSGGNNLSATANDVLTLMCRRAVNASAKEWWEVSRTVNAD